MPSGLPILWRYLTGLRPYLHARTSPAERRRALTERLARREETFLQLVERGVFANPASPYRPLFRAAGIELGDAARLVRDQGLEGALAVLYDAGVHVTLDETRGTAPIVRPGVELAVGPAAFDNPLAAPEYGVRSGGSRSAGTPFPLNFRSAANEATYFELLLEAFVVGDRPIAFWHPAPPGMAGLAIALRFAALGYRAERWYTQNDPWRGSAGRFAAFTALTVAAARALGRPVPVPRHLPPEQVDELVRWSASAVARGTPPFLLCTPSSAVRICQAAAARRADIGGTFFRVGGEPYTPGRAAVIEAAGATAASDYVITETAGYTGLACAAPEAPDEVHLLTDKLAVIQRDTTLASGVRLPTLVFTTLLPFAPRLMINLVSDDFGFMRERDCGCAIGEAGLGLHLHTIRSHEKLTSEGMNFLGSELITLLEEHLPARFGGAAGDYQLVEEERDGLPRISLLVSPRIGPLDAADAAAAVLTFLAGRGDAQQMMADVWAQAGTLAVVRAEPRQTRGAKELPLHVVRAT